MEDLEDLSKKSTLAFSPLKPGRKGRRTTEVMELSPVDEYRRVFGAAQLMTAMGTEKPEEGHSYHVITGGNVDLLSHLLWVLLLYKKVRHVFISAWAISSADILLCARYLEERKVGTLELLLGEIFPAKYKMEWKKLMEMYNAGKITDIFTSAIHSKVMLIDVGDGTKIVIESSANCNMNPRIEQSCVTVSGKLYDFYHYYLHEILDAEEARYVSRETLKIQVKNGNKPKADLDDDEGSAILWKD